MLKFKKFIILSAIFSFLVVASPAWAKNSLQEFWEVLSGKNKDENAPDPSKTLEAPFGNDQVSGKESEFSHYKDDDYSSELLDIKNQHRNNRDIAEWASESSATLLTFSVQDLDLHEKQIDELMTSAGKKEFNDFIENTRLLDIMKSNNVRLVSIIDDTPKLIKSGTFGGIYRWLFEVPIKISYVPLGVSDYEKDAIPKSQDVLIKVQITRVGAKVGPHNVKIEGWEVKGRKKKKKDSIL